jgi:D-3-phosphoglycerate dehydrogenase
MLRQCDAVSVHTVLNGETRGLIDGAALACLQPSAILLNVSRGAIINEAALVQAVLTGRLGGVGLDVFSSEPVMKEGHVMSPLFGRENVILFPHLTFFTHEAMHRLSEDTLARCDEMLAGRPVTIRSHDPRLRRQSAPRLHFS